MEIIFYGHSQDGEQGEVQTVSVSFDGRELGTMRLTREKATRLFRYFAASREKDFKPTVFFRGEFLDLEHVATVMVVPGETDKSYFAVCINERLGVATEAEEAEFEARGAVADEILTKELGKFGWASGADNGWALYVVDEASKVPALQAAWPKEPIIEMTPVTYAQWCAAFGEFNPRGTIADWYRRCMPSDKLAHESRPFLEELLMATQPVAKQPVAKQPKPRGFRRVGGGRFGFTLIEFFIIVAIVGIAATMLISTLCNYYKNKNDPPAQTALQPVPREGNWNDALRETIREVCLEGHTYYYGHYSPGWKDGVAVLASKLTDDGKPVKCGPELEKEK